MKKTALLFFLAAFCCIGKSKADNVKPDAWINIIHPCTGEIVKFAAGTTDEEILDKIDEWAKECEGGQISPEV